MAKDFGGGDGETIKRLGWDHESFVKTREWHVRESCWWPFCVCNVGPNWSGPQGGAWWSRASTLKSQLSTNWLIEWWQKTLEKFRVFCGLINWIFIGWRHVAAVVVHSSSSSSSSERRGEALYCYNFLWLIIAFTDNCSLGVYTIVHCFQRLLSTPCSFIIKFNK